MSRIILDFEEYQNIRNAMAFARGNLQALNDGPCVGEDGLRHAGEILEEARWRTELEDFGDQ